AMLSGREVALLDRAFLTETFCALEEQLHALTATKTTYCSGITCHLLFLLFRCRPVYAIGPASSRSFRTPFPVSRFSFQKYLKHSVQYCGQLTAFLRALAQPSGSIHPDH